MQKVRERRSGPAAREAAPEDHDQEVHGEGSTRDRDTTAPDLLDLADKPEDPKQDQPKDPKQDQPKDQRLADWRRADLHRSGITDEIIDGPVQVADAPNGKGWTMRWTDGKPRPGNPKARGFELVIPDRDKRPADGRKTLWPKGVTLYPGCVRPVPDADLIAYVEGQRQALAFASHAPTTVEVWCLPGINAIHPGIADRLTRTRGRRVLLVPDADWRSNGQVGRAALELVPAVLADAADVLIADTPGIGKDGMDDILGRTREEDRAALVAQIIEQAGPVRDRRLELETERQRIMIQARDRAQRQLAAQVAADLPAPSITSLADLLAEPDDLPAYRVDRLWPTGGNVILAAQRKAGKTTLAGNLIRSLADGAPFLADDGPVLVGREGFDVTPLDGTVALLDLELDRRMLRRWLRDQGIGKTDRVLAESLRGRAHLFDVLDDERRQRWADFLIQHQVQVLVLDPLGALLDAYGRDENSNSDVGPVLQALDQLKDAAHVQELLLVHHFGHGPERSRGASKLRGWPDAEWFLYREKAANGEEPPPDAARFFAAEGRDVAVTEQRLSYDPATRRLTIAGGNRVQHQATKHGPAVLAIITQHPGLSGREITDQAMAEGIAKHPAENALRALIRAGQVRTEPGPKRARLHYPAEEPDQDRAQRQPWDDDWGGS